MKIRAVVVLAVFAVFGLVGYATAVEPVAVALSLTSSAPASTFAQNVTFTVTTDPPITATLSVIAGRTAVGTMNVVDGVGTWTSDELPAGPLTIWVECQSDCTGRSDNFLQSIERALVNMKASIDTPFTDAGQVARITVSTSLSAGDYTPSGKIDVVENDIILATAALTNGTATLDVADLPTGEHVFSIRYSGNRNCFDAATELRHTVAESRIGVDPVAIPEGNASSNPVSVNVYLSGRSSHEVEVQWATADGSAIAGRDYDAASGTLTFAPGETKKQIEVNVIGNTKPEQEKTFTIVVTGPNNAADAAVRILNDDPFFERKPGLSYGPAAEQTLDLYVPVTGDGPFPVIVGVEATDFIAPDANAKVTLHEAERGYIVAKISFRPDEIAAFPAQVEDVKAAVRWLRANATQFQIDPNRIGVWGIGPGGHIAALLGTTDESFDTAAMSNTAFSSRVQAVVDWYGEIDFTQLASEVTYARYLGCAALDCPEIAASANAANYASSGDAPLLMVYGAKDTSVPAPTVQDLYAALRNSGVDARFSIVDGAGHGGPEWNDPALLEQVDRFFDEKLKQ